MYKSQYDNDVTLWSPAGRLHQLEYACSAVNQGSVVIGLKSDTHCILVGLRRTPNKDLAMHQEKLFKIDDHVAIGVSGLISDGRRMCKYMRSETLNYKYVYNKPMPLSRLILDVADKNQNQTQSSQGRPYGVGLLVIGYDQNGTHLYETDAAGNFYEYYAHAIGARNQAAKTYLEKTYETFPKSNVTELIQHGVNALKETVRTRKLSLNTDNTSVVIIGADMNCKQLSEEELDIFIQKVEGNENDEDNDTEMTDVNQKKEKESMDVDPK